MIKSDYDIISGVSLRYDLHGAQRPRLEVSDGVVAEHVAADLPQREQESHPELVQQVHAAATVARRTVWEDQG